MHSITLKVMTLALFLSIFCFFNSLVSSYITPESLSTAAATRFVGSAAGDWSGYSISSAGDFNNDGFDDILIGANNAEPNGFPGAGETYLIFGKTQSFGSEFNFSSLDGTNGVIFNGIDVYDYSGQAISSAGDFNNDGYADILIGAWAGDPNGDSTAGETYLIFGTSTPLGSPFDLSSLNGANGIVFNGIDANDQSGYSVSSAGDFNNDGFDDILIGANTADPNGNSNAGETYLIFGTNQSWSSQFNLSSINGTNGIIFNGIDASDASSRSLSSAGDFNNDGFDDILIGADYADPNGNSNAGETYLIFGTNQFLGVQFDLSSINGTNGIMFNGIDASDGSGSSVSSAGDFNNDGFGDILISAKFGDPNGNTQAGETYLIFGTNQSLGSQFNLSSLNGINGITFNGILAFDRSSESVSSAGDVDNDGFDDILIGAKYVEVNGNTEAGATYLIFGTNQSFSFPFNLSSINGSNGIVFEGISSGDFSGFSVASAGDFNNDGKADILIGANQAEPNGQVDAGETYLILGGSFKVPDSNDENTDEETVSNSLFETLSLLILFLSIVFFL